MNFLYRVLIIFSVSLMFSSLGLAKEETLEDIASEINDIREQISKLETSNVKEVIKIDKALKELDKVMEFVNEKVSAGDMNTAVLALDFTERTMKDIETSIPKEFKSENIGDVKKEFSKDEMQKISKMTQEINKNKKNKVRKLAESMKEVKDKGLDTYEIASNINQIGIETIDSKEINKAIAENLSSSYLRKEMEDQQRFSLLLGDSQEEVSFALREVDVVQSGDPKKFRAFEIEKYGTLSGLDQSTITKGMKAVFSGDIETEKRVTIEIYNKLSQNPNFVVVKLNSDQLDKMMSENIAVERIVNGAVAAGGDAAMTLAKLNGENHVKALEQLRIHKELYPTRTLAEQAASYQANVRNELDIYAGLKYDNYKISELTTTYKSQLIDVYTEVLTEKSIAVSKAAAVAAVEAEASLKEAKKVVEETSTKLEGLNEVENIVKENLKTKQAELDEIIEAGVWGEKRVKLTMEVGQLKYEVDVASRAAAEVTQELDYAKASVNITLNEISLLEKMAKETTEEYVNRLVTESEDPHADFLKSLQLTPAEDLPYPDHGVVKDAATATSEVSSSASEAAQSVTSEVSSSASEAAQEVAETTSEVAQEVAETTSEVAQEVAETTSEVAQEVAESVSETAQEVAESVSETVQSEDPHADFLKSLQLTPAEDLIELKY